jgi:hypothetical protein
MINKPSGDALDASSAAGITDVAWLGDVDHAFFS